MNTNGLRNRLVKSKMDSSELILIKKVKVNNSNLVIYLIKWFVACVIAIYFSVPFFLKYSSFLRRWFLFMNYVNYQAFLNLSQPELDYGLNCTRTFKITSTDSIQLGVWHILPKSKLPLNCLQGSEDTFFNHLKDFQDSRPVVLYFHGNGGTRGGGHRLSLYKRLAYEADFHILAMDYRGYGDSTNIQPSSTGVSQDGLSVYNWLFQFVNTSRINIWGHSLGSAIAIKMISNLPSSQLPNSLILDGAFNQIYDVVINYKLSQVYFCFNFFLDMIGRAFAEDKNTNFNSENLIKDFDLPILILHARDDKFVPHYLGVKLYKAAMINVTKKKHVPKMISYDTYLQYGHKNIWKDPNLIQTITNFINTGQ